MGKIVLLAVAAAWAAVLLPPLLRSRLENRPNSSVTDFRRQLSTLQRTVPTRTMVPMRGMARPLTQGPLSRAAMPYRLGEPAGRLGAARPMAPHAATARRTHATQPGARPDDGHRQVHMGRPVSAREAMRRRRMNVLVVLSGGVCITLFLAATTKSDAMLYAFALAFVSLCGYCYKLVQLRQVERDRLYGETAWFNAA